LGEKIRAGDSIVLIESSGIHANGLTLARRVAEELPLGYETKLSNGKEYGDALLTPTHLYSPLVDRVLEEGLDIHYMVNMTGHGWRKLMRANRPFVYQVHTIPRPQEEFDLIKRTANLSYKDMYETFNMGAGYAFMLPGDQAETLLGISESFGLEALFAGQVRHGEKKVVIEPKQIIFDADSLQIK
jgi:phosphoribosylformylglycinamidine cyclo-ligase